MNRSTVLPIHRTNTIGQYKDQRNEIMKGSKHIRTGSKAELVCLRTEGCLYGSLRGLGGIV